MPSLDSTLLASAIQAEATRQGVDPTVALGIFSSENGSLASGTLRVNPNVSTETTSPVGASGIMQVMPKTLQGLIEQGFLPSNIDTTKPAGQIQAGVAAIKELNSRGITNPIHVAVGYNASPAVLAAYKAGQPIPAETTDYIKKFSQATGAKTMATSTRESVSGRDVPPEVQQALTDSQARSASISDSVLKNLQGMTDFITGNTAKVTDALRSEGEASATAAETQGSINADRVNAQNDLLSTFGININDPTANQGLVDNIRTIQQTQEARKPITAQIAALRSTDMLSDPAGWLVNNFKAMPLIAKHNALNSIENEAVQNLQALQALHSNQAAKQPEATAQLLQTKAYAAAKLARAEADQKIAATEGIAQQNIARNLVEQANISGADVSQRLAMAKLYAERFSITNGQSEKDGADTDLLKQVNLQAATLGLAPYTKLTFSTLPGDTKDRLVRASSSGTWGRDIGEAISTIHELKGDRGIQQLTMDQPMLGKFLQSAVAGGTAELQAMESTAAKTGIPNQALKQAKTDADRLQAGISSWQAKMKAETVAGDYSKLSEGNPAKLDYAMTANLPALATSPTAKFVRDYAANGVKGSAVKMDDNLLLSNAIARVQTDPTSLPKVSQDLYKFYKGGTTAKNMDVGLSQLGWPPTNEYPVWAGITTFKSHAVQLLNPTSIENWLQMQVSVGLTKEVVSGHMGDFGGVQP